MRALCIILAGLFSFPMTAWAQDTAAVSHQMLKAMRREGVQVRVPNCSAPPCRMGAIPDNMTPQEFMDADQIDLGGLVFNQFPQFVFEMKNLKFLDIKGVTGTGLDWEKLQQLRKLEIYRDQYRNSVQIQALATMPQLRALHLSTYYPSHGTVVGYMAPFGFDDLVVLDLRDDTTDASCSARIPFVSFQSLKTLKISAELRPDYQDIFSLPSLEEFEGPECATNNVIRKRLE